MTYNVVDFPGTTRRRDPMMDFSLEATSSNDLLAAVKSRLAATRTKLSEWVGTTPMPAIGFVQTEGPELCKVLLHKLGFSAADVAFVAAAWVELGQQDASLIASAEAAAASKAAAKASKKGTYMKDVMQGICNN